MRKKLLKIDDNIELSKLVEYGFNQISYKPHVIEYFKKVYLENDEDDRVCYHVKEDDRLLRITRLDGEVLDDTLLRLIQDNIVKVGDCDDSMYKI